MKEKQLAVIKHFGMDHQRRKLEEEVLELQEAIIEYSIVRNIYAIQKDESEKARKHLTKLRRHIVEEMADVNNLLGQFKLAFHITDEELNTVLTSKVNRTYALIPGKDE